MALPEPTAVPAEAAPGEQPPAGPPLRISRQELYEDVSSGARCSHVYLTTVALSSVGDIALALAAGSSAALAFTTGVPATLVGVMVAVALLPPVVAAGLLLGGGRFGLAWGALQLFLVNLICVNLSQVTTFLVQGIRPARWWERERAGRTTRIAISLWVLLLAALVAMIRVARTK